jgi:hypothetical protein
MIDRYGRPLREPFSKDFVDPVREKIPVEDWKTLPPAAGSRGAIVLSFSSSLDWVLLLRRFTIRSAIGFLNSANNRRLEFQMKFSFQERKTVVRSRTDIPGHMDVKSPMESRTSPTDIPTAWVGAGVERRNRTAKVIRYRQILSPSPFISRLRIPLQL